MNKSVHEFISMCSWWVGMCVFKEFAHSKQKINSKCTIEMKERINYHRQRSMKHYTYIHIFEKIKVFPLA